jgi:hypothetical protein
MKVIIAIDIRGTVRRRSGAWTVVEVLIASGIGALFMVGVVLTSISSIRNFAEMYNYTDMNMDSRIAIDEIARNIRGAIGVDVQATNILTLTNASGTVTYTWTPSTATLICDQGPSTSTVLTHCDSWQFALYERAPSTNYDNTTNSNPSAVETKLLSMKWTCSRTVMGLKLNTETMQEARIVLRNEAQ